MKIAVYPCVFALVIATLGGAAQAKLPAPSDAAKAAAAAAADKAAWSNKVATYQLCKAQDKAVANFLSSAKAAGKDIKAPTPTPACVEPGPYVAAEAKPIEAAGAHSPAATATSPPSTLQPDAVANPAKKP